MVDCCHTSADDVNVRSVLDEAGSDVLSEALIRAKSDGRGRWSDGATVTAETSASD